MRSCFSYFLYVFYLCCNFVVFVTNEIKKNIYSMWPFSIFYILLHNQRQKLMFKKLIILIIRRDAYQISWPFVKHDFDMLCILNLPIHA